MLSLKGSKVTTILMVAFLMLQWCGRVLAVQQVNVRDGIFFEAEDFDAAHPQEEGFASVTGDKATSSGTVVYRFQHGTVTYRFTVAKAGTYKVWLRYGAPGNTVMDVAMDPADLSKLSRLEMPSTGGCVGPGVWRWMVVWSGPLTAGEHVLALGSAALRPDCLYVTASANSVPDDKMLGEVQWPLGPRLPELKHDRSITRHPAWLQQDLRVCYAHSEWNPDVTIEQWCKMAAEHGANVICAAGEIPSGMLNGKMKSLPVNTKSLPAGYKVDYSWVKRYTDAAHANGLKYLCYVNADRTLDPLLIEHPEWRQVGMGGPQATWGCWNSPYRKAFIDRMVQIAKESHLDGIMIDMPFTAPSMGCRSKYCVAEFEKLFGVGPPRTCNLKDPLYQRWLDFQSWTREEWLLDLTTALHSVNPDFAVVVNQTCGWIFDTERVFLTPRAGRCVDGLLEEIGWETQHTWNRPWGWPLQDAWQSLFLRCRTWPGSGQMWHVTYNMPEVDLRAHAFSMLANGVAPAVTTGGNWPQMGRIWQHIKECEPWTLDAQLVPWAAIHFSERTLMAYANAAGADATNAYIKNVFGVFQAMLERHIPVAIISDDDIADTALLNKYAVVVLPNSACLSEVQAKALHEYVQNGGGLFATFQTGCFDEFGAARKQPVLADLFGAQQGKVDAGIHWTCRLDSLNHPILQDPAISASGGWQQGLIDPLPSATIFDGPADRSIGMVETSGLEKGVDSLLPMSGSYRRLRGGIATEKGWSDRALLVRSYGKGKVVYSPYDLGQSYYCYNHPLARALLVNSVQWAASRPSPLHVEAPMIVETVLYQKGDATVVHLLNDISSFGRAAAPNPEEFGGFRAEVIPVHDLRIGLDGAFAKLFLEPGGVALKGDQKDGVTWVTIPELKQHAMLVAEK